MPARVFFSATTLLAVASVTAGELWRKSQDAVHFPSDACCLLSSVACFAFSPMPAATSSKWRAKGGLHGALRAIGCDLHSDGFGERCGCGREPPIRTPLDRSLGQMRTEIDASHATRGAWENNPFPRPLCFGFFFPWMHAAWIGHLRTRDVRNDRYEKRVQWAKASCNLHVARSLLRLRLGHERFFLAVTLRRDTTPRPSPLLLAGGRGAVLLHATHARAHARTKR